MMRDIFGRNLAPVAKREGDVFGDLRSTMNSMLEDFYAGWPRGNVELWGKDVKFMPRVEFHETKDAYEVSAELPGMKPADVEVTVTRDGLTIKGEKKTETERSDKQSTYSERVYGSFMRTIPFTGEVDREKVEANFKDGLLKVHVPKTTTAKMEARSVSIKQG